MFFFANDMRRLKKWFVFAWMILVPCLTAAPFIDDFESDTTADYIGTRTYGNGSVAFDVSNGVLNVVTGNATTYSVFNRTARLEVGECVSVVSMANNATDLYLTVSTIARSPNTGSEDGIRLQVQTAANIRARIYRDGAESVVNYGSYPTGGDLRLYVFRITETTYSVGYDGGGGLVILGEAIDIPQTAGVAGLYVGVEGYGAAARRFDNLQIETHASSITLQKGPYLICTGVQTDMQMHWQVSGMCACTLDWGRDTDYADGQTTTTEYNAEHQHFCTMTGLQPGFRYYYRLRAGADEFLGSFQAPPRDFSRNVTFYAYGNTRTRVDAHNDVCRAILSECDADPSSQTLVLHAGEWVDFGKDEDAWSSQYFSLAHEGIRRMLGSLPVMGCVGAHDTQGAGPSVLLSKYWPYGYADRDEGLYYSFDYGPVHIAVLDQYTDAAYDLGPAQIEWLENDLAATDKEWKVLVMNVPGWSAGRDPVNDWGVENKLQIQQLIQRLCKTYGVDVVLSGHYGYYARCLVDGVHHVTTGAAGAPFDYPGPGSDDAPYLVAGPVQQHAFCKIKVRGNRLFFETLAAADGTLLDSFVVHHGLPGDANEDGAVDLSDFANLAAAWLGYDDSADFNASNHVDNEDLRILASSFLTPLQRQDSNAIDITEFMADNQQTLLDEDGDTPDWIEVFNGDDVPVNLYDWCLTDDPADLTKWRFPPVEMPSEGLLIVFASGKDRRTVGGQLHTNFTLPAADGYLALVKPDGTTIVREYQGVDYPPQRPDVSFGLFMEN